MLRIDRAPLMITVSLSISELLDRRGLSRRRSYQEDNKQTRSAGERNTLLPEGRGHICTRHGRIAYGRFVVDPDGANAVILISMARRCGATLVNVRGGGGRRSRGVLVVNAPEVGDGESGAAGALACRATVRSHQRCRLAMRSARTDTSRVRFSPALFRGYPARYVVKRATNEERLSEYLTRPARIARSGLAQLSRSLRVSPVACAGAWSSRSRVRVGLASILGGMRYAGFPGRRKTTIGAH
jgi:hypothetical protein